MNDYSIDYFDAEGVLVFKAEVSAVDNSDALLLACARIPKGMRVHRVIIASVEEIGD